VFHPGAPGRGAQRWVDEAAPEAYRRARADLGKAHNAAESSRAVSSGPIQSLESLVKRLQRGFHRLSDALIHYSIRFSPTEVQRTFGVTLVVGASCGVLAVAFHGAIVLASKLFILPAMRSAWWPLWTIATPTLGGLLAGIALHYLPQARGRGSRQVKAAYAVQTARLRFRDGFA